MMLVLIVVFLFVLVRPVWLHALMEVLQGVAKKDRQGLNAELDITQNLSWNYSLDSYEGSCDAQRRLM